MNERPFEKKQKPKLRWWWFLFIPVFLIGMIVIQAIGPNPPIKLGPDTTVISEPLRENGMPNYTEYLVRKGAEGVTPDNNAAVLYWRALWPGELDPKHEQAIVDALEIDWPDANESLESPYDPAMLAEVGDWIIDTVPNAEVEFLLEEAESEIISRALAHRWQPGELPFIDAWAARNEQALDWLVEGSMRPKYFSPPPNYAAGEDAMLFAWLLPDIQMMRSASRALLLRAMWHISHDRYSDAWDNIFASYRMSRHSGASGTFLIHLLVGIAVEAMTNDTFLTLLDQEGLSSELLERIQKDFDSLQPLTPIHEVFAEGERFGSLDIATRISQGDSAGEAEFVLDSAGPQIAHMAGRIRVDWNVVLRAANAWFDRFEEVAKLPYQERKEKLEQIDVDLQGLNPTRSPGRLAYSLVSVGARSEVVADTLLMLLLPATQAAVRVQDRGDMNRSLIRLSIALARYRKAQGEFPAALHALETKFIAAVPNDLYSDGKPIYQRRQNGYLLYSVFENEIDDGGTGIGGNIVRGEYVKEARSADLAASDLVVRMPRPTFELPDIPLADNDELEGEEGGEQY